MAYLKGEGKMSCKKALILSMVCVLLLCACDYIVTPEPEADFSAASKGWNAVVTNVAKSEAGDLHIDITIRNDTTEWSVMQAAAGKPAVLTASDGKATNCDTVFVGTGGHRLAPGFQMRGYTTGTKAEPKTQIIYAECKGAEASSGARLAFDIIYYTGEFNYYDPEIHKSTARLEMNVDKVAKDLKYPVATTIEGLILKPDAEIKAINDCLLTLTDVARTEKGLQFKWQTSNPGDYPTYVHIGNPPVIGEDGIIYGLYESPHLATAPITGAGKTAEWTTEVITPKDAKGLYILESVESKQQRLFTNYAVDITNK